MAHPSRCGREDAFKRVQGRHKVLGVITSGRDWDEQLFPRSPREERGEQNKLIFLTRYLFNFQSYFTKTQKAKIYLYLDDPMSLSVYEFCIERSMDVVFYCYCYQHVVVVILSITQDLVQTMQPLYPAKPHPSTEGIVGRCSTTEIHPSPLLKYYFEQVSLSCPNSTWNLP